MISRYEGPNQFFFWTNAWIQILDGVIIICSLGFIHSKISLKFLFWWGLRSIRKARDDSN